jgi:hypothetical protein
LKEDGKNEEVSWFSSENAKESISMRKPVQKKKKKITFHCLPQDLFRVRQGKLPKHFDHRCSRTKTGTG